MTAASERRLARSVRPLEPVERSNAGARAARAMGILVAVDDTGQGRAGFDCLLAVRPDIIKTDRLPVEDIDRDAGRRALMSGLLSFAREQGATVAAEGVETAAELETLASLGVPLAQGYHLGRPEPLPDLSDQRSATRFTVAPSET